MYTSAEAQSFYERTKGAFPQSVVNRINQYIGDQRPIIDLACGTGGLGQAVSVELGYIEYYSDICLQMCIRTKLNVSRSSVVICADWLNGFADNTLGVVLTKGALHLQDHPLVAINEVKHRLKNDGLLCLISTISEDMKSKESAIDLFKYFGFRHRKHFWTSSELLSLVSESGLSILDGFAFRSDISLKEWLSAKNLTNIDEMLAPIDDHPLVVRRHAQLNLKRTLSVIIARKMG